MYEIIGKVCDKAKKYSNMPLYFQSLKAWCIVRVLSPRPSECAADSLKSAALLLFGFLCQKALPRFIFLLSFPYKKAIIISNFA